jgi:hypothetical protein
MPDLALGLAIGEGDANAALGTGGPDGVIQSEAGDFLLVEAGQFLAFDE